MASFKSTGETFLFPIELIHLIVDEVDAQTKSNPRSRLSTLCALCHVCKAFYFAARSQLLSTISLHLPDTQERNAALVNVLSSDSSSIQDIRSLTLKFDAPEIKPITHPSHASDFRALSVDLISLALQSNSLHHISLEGCPQIPLYTLHWDQIGDPDLLSAILDGIHSNPSLQSFRVSNIHGLPWNLLLSQFKSKLLRKLILNNIQHFEIDMQKKHEGCLPSSSALEKIECLILLGRSTIRSIANLSRRVFEPPMSSNNPRFTHLRTLRINAPTRADNWSDFRDFILALAEILESLELRIGTVHRASFRTIPLNELHKLTTLKIFTELRSGLLDPFFYPDDLGAVCRFIRCASSSPQLTSIHISFLYAITCSASTAQSHQASNSGFINGTAWRELDAELSWNKPGFETLQYIFLQIEKYYHCDEASIDETRIKDANSNIPISNILPLTCQRATLRETDFRVNSIYTAESMTELVERWF
ncbi:hypothetical protein BDN70DRAFT_871053 [Pholiota conissans]|uniref:Uncharacterized protein n=1 Tax=Pholiota conissans TaxID=109636 RepID=A0A9P5ZE16_9AGAR|nr:hypothetical protein BDN70DRAFT_871053 [Pholiota conissans]